MSQPGFDVRVASLAASPVALRITSQAEIAKAIELERTRVNEEQKAYLELDEAAEHVKNKLKLQLEIQYDSAVLLFHSFV